MTLAQQVLALRQFFGTPPDAPLPVAIEMMNVAVGVASLAGGEGAGSTSPPSLPQGVWLPRG